ncbi:unnamed protein product [Arabidopsis thaliana]|uniref:Transmembrane protein n=1 Tax=Arabidopsis thaliana TaxID=3702 RepID=A0A5S9WJL3_ARATH|nr:unnamed protein product [Arabidopsis thaliana]
MNVNEARGIDDEFTPPPQWILWWASCSYSRTVHELIIGYIMAVNIYNNTVLEIILSPLFLLYLSFGICELSLICRWSDDPSLIWCISKVLGRISHAIGYFILLSMLFESSDSPAERYIGILYFIFFMLIILLYVFTICLPKITDYDPTTCLDAELLLDDSHAETHTSWWESRKLGRIMYELILGANLIMIAHYHIPVEIYGVSIMAFLCFFPAEFSPSVNSQALGRSIAQMIGVLTVSYFIYYLISPVFALGLATISVLGIQ